MSKKSGYKQQQNLSAIQILSESPSFIATLLSAVFSRTLLLFVDLLDSLSYIVRNALVMLLSRKLTKDLRFEYNYGIGKIEAVSSIMCDGIMLFGMFLTVCLSVYSIFYPSRPSDLLIGVAGFKLYDLMWELAFFIKQRKIYKLNRSAICKANYAAAFGSLLYDGISWVALFVMWLLRNHPIGGYISPVAGILVAVYLTVGCVKRIKTSLGDLTDKTLPEDQQLKILKLLSRYYDSYSQVYSINSRKGGDVTRIDLHLSFENDTSVEEVVSLQKQMQKDFEEEIGGCVVNIIMREE